MMDVHAVHGAGVRNETEWLVRAMERPWSRSRSANDVASIVPRGFAACARVFHPPMTKTASARSLRKTGWRRGRPPPMTGSMSQATNPMRIEWRLSEPGK